VLLNPGGFFLAPVRNHFHGLLDSFFPGLRTFCLGYPFQMFALVGRGAVHKEFMQSLLFQGVGKIFWDVGHIGLGWL
jgi:hypothetical protein